MYERPAFSEGEAEHSKEDVDEGEEDGFLGELAVARFELLVFVEEGATSVAEHGDGEGGGDREMVVRGGG